MPQFCLWGFRRLKAPGIPKYSDDDWQRIGLESMVELGLASESVPGDNKMKFYIDKPIRLKL